MKISRIVAVLSLLAFAALARAQTSTGPFSVNSTATANCPAISVGDNATVGIHVEGTFSMTLQPQIAIGGRAPSNTTVYPYGSTTSQGTITSAGDYNTSVAAASTFVMCASAYVSGSATIILTVSPAQSKSGAGGGGGTNNPGGSAGQIQTNGGSVFGAFTASGDCTINTTTGAVTCTKTNGTAFGTLATATTATPVVSLFSGCSGTQYLGADGACHTGSAGTVTTTGSPTSGVITKFSGSTSVTNAAAADIVSLFSTCSGTQYLGADGACHTGGTGTMTSSGYSTGTPLAAFSTSTNVTPATYTNVVALFGSGSCSGYLKNDGTCATPGGGNVSNTGTPVSQQVAEWTSATVVKGTTGFTDSGTQLTYTGQFQTDLLGAGNQAACQVTASGTYTNTQACADYMEGTLGLRSGIINSRPEVISTDPFTVNFSPDWRLSTGPTNSTTCDDSGSNTNCTVAEVPIIIGASGLTIGLGPVLSGQNMSQGSLILSGPTNWKPPVGIPTEGSPTCSGTGGPAGATYYIGVQMVVNLETHSGKSPFAGPSAFVGKTVTCTTGQSTITVTAPTGGNAGSFTKTDYRIGIAANSTAAGIGDYYVQQPGVATTCGSAGTIDSTNDCLISGGSSTVAIASIQTASTSFPMAADNNTGDPVDLSNVMIVMGTRSTISFLEQFRDTAIACPSTGQGVNNPNVLIWNLNGEEGAGTNNGTVQIYGDCGGYAGIAGGFVYSESHTPNSTWSQVTMSGGPTSGAVPFFGLMCDGRPDGSGSASGCPREMNNVTIALRGGGTADVDVEEQGDRAWLGISNFHGETQSSQDNIFVTNGAHLVFNHVEGFTGGNSIHLSSTAGFSSGVGICPQGSATTYQERCSSGSVAIQDDTDASGSQPLLGYQAHWASNGTPSYFGNVTSNAAIKTTGNGVDAGYFALGGNTANFAVTANTVGFMGPTSATFTAYAMQIPSTAPSGTQYLGCGTPSSGVSTCAWGSGGSGGDTITSPNSTLTIGGTATNTTLDLAGSAGEIMAGATPALTYTPTLGKSGTAGSLAMFPASGNFTTTWASGATASNTIQGFATVPTTGHLLDCTVTSTTCLMHDSGIVTANAVTAASTLTTHGVALGAGTKALSVTAVGATNTVLNGTTGADPSFGALPLAALATQTADTMVANMTAGTAVPTAVAIPTTAHGVWLGEGTGTAPGITAAGATNTVLHGNTGADPTYSAVALGDMATQAADSVVMNATGGSAAPTAVVLPACAASGHADVYDPSTHSWTCNSISGGSSALSGITAATGANTIASGNNGAQIWNWAQTTNSQAAMTFGETTAATGTSDQEVVVSTLAGSTATPFTITQGTLSGTTSIPALNITSTINNGSYNGTMIVGSITNTTSGAPSFLKFNGGSAGTTLEMNIDLNGNLSMGGNIFGTASSQNISICGANSGTCNPNQNTLVGGVVLQGANNTATTSGGKAGFAVLSGGLLNSATPNAAELEGVVQVQAGYLKGSAIAALGDVVCGTTTQYTVTDCPTSAANIVGIADTIANPVGVVTDGQALVKFDGVVTLGDVACMSTTAAGQAHDGGTTACTLGTAIGTIVADSGTLTIQTGTSQTATAMSTTLALVQLHISQ